MDKVNQTIYKDFFEFWEAKYKNNITRYAEEIEAIALDAWDSCVNGMNIETPVFCATCGKKIYDSEFCSQECSEYETLE